MLWTEGMGPLFRLTCLAVLAVVANGPQPPEVALQSGDVVLQASRSGRSALIRRASRSPYSHVGLVEVGKEGTFVLEAIQPVSRTPLRAFVRRGEGQWVTVLRPRGLDATARERVVAEARRALGRPYDARYLWDDERLYCSELVAKAFARGAGRTVGRQEPVRSLRLTRAELELAQRLGVRPEQTLVTPGSLVDLEAFEVLAVKTTRVR